MSALREYIAFNHINRDRECCRILKHLSSINVCDYVIVLQFHAICRLKKRIGRSWFVQFRVCKQYTRQIFGFAHIQLIFLHVFRFAFCFIDDDLFQCAFLASVVYNRILRSCETYPLYCKIVRVNFMQQFSFRFDDDGKIKCPRAAILIIISHCKFNLSTLSSCYHRYCWLWATNF